MYTRQQVHTHYDGIYIYHFKKKKKVVIKTGAEILTSTMQGAGWLHYKLYSVVQCMIVYTIIKYR